MAAPTIGRPRARPRNATIEESHPLASRLLDLWLPTANETVVGLRGTPLTASGTPKRGAGYLGEGATYSTAPAADGHRFTTGTAGKFSVQFPITVAWAGHITGTPTSNAHFFGVQYDTAGGSPFSCASVGVGVGTLRATSNNGSYSESLVGSPGAGYYVLVCLCDGSTVTLWVNGVRRGGATACAGTVSYSSTSEVSFSYYAGLARDTAAVHHMGAIWNRALRAPEIAQLAADPFCMLRY